MRTVKLFKVYSKPLQTQKSSFFWKKDPKPFVEKAEIALKENNILEAFTNFLTAADNGDKKSAEWIGDFYLRGDTEKGMKPDIKKSVNYFKKALGGEFPKVYGKLGVLKLKEGSVKEAIKYFEEGAALNDGSSMSYLATILLEGKDLPKDVEKAKSLLEKASEVLPLAFDILATVYSREEKDDEKAKQCYEKAIEKGVKRSYFGLGNIYKKSGNYAKAIEIYELGRKHLDIGCLLALGNIYAEGVHAKVDFPLATQLFEQAFQLGSPEAGNFLAGYLEMGINVSQDEEKAFKIYEKVAFKRNSNYALTRHAFQLYTGVGGKKDIKKAWRILLDIEEKSKEAPAHFGFLFQIGAGAFVDNMTALKKYKKGVEHGDPIAYYLAATIYESDKYFGDKKLAEEHYKKFYEIASNHDVYTLMVMLEKGPKNNSFLEVKAKQMRQEFEMRKSKKFGN